MFPNEIWMQRHPLCLGDHHLLWNIEVGATERRSLFTWHHSLHLFLIKAGLSEFLSQLQLLSICHLHGDVLLMWSRATPDTRHTLACVSHLHFISLIWGFFFSLSGLTWEHVVGAFMIFYFLCFKTMNVNKYFPESAIDLWINLMQVLDQCKLLVFKPHVIYLIWTRWRTSIRSVRQFDQAAEKMYTCKNKVNQKYIKNKLEWIHHSPTVQWNSVELHHIGLIDISLLNMPHFSGKLSKNPKSELKVENWTASSWGHCPQKFIESIWVVLKWSAPTQTNQPTNSLGGGKTLITAFFSAVK